MPTLDEKKAVVEEIAEDLKRSSAVYVTNYTGMSVSDMGELRGAFRKGDVHFKVYKNKLVKRAMESIGGYDEIFPYLKEQNGFAFAEEEIAAPAKVLKEHIQKHNKPAFKAAVIDGAFFNENQLETLASMKSKDEIIGDVIGLLLSPISNVVSALQAQGSNIVGAIKTISESEN